MNRESHSIRHGPGMDMAILEYQAVADLDW